MYITGRISGRIFEWQVNLNRGIAAIAWEGDSLDVISSFPDPVKQNLGYQLRLLQQGERPTDYRPVTSIGSGVFELRDEMKEHGPRDLLITNKQRNLRSTLL